MLPLRKQRLLRRSELLSYEREGYRNPYEIIESSTEDELFFEFKRQDYASLQEYKEYRKRIFRSKNSENSSKQQDRTGRDETNIETIIATEDLMMDTRTTQTMSNADKAQNKSRDLSKIDILDDNTDWEKMKLTTQKLIAQKNKKAFNYYQDEDNTMADMPYQRMEQSKQKQK